MRGLLLFLLASAALAGEEWPSARGDPLNSGVTKNRGPMATPQVAWKREEKDAISPGVALGMGRLAYGVGEFVVAYREASDGREVWNGAVKQQISAWPAIRGEGVYVGSPDHVHYILKLESGKEAGATEATAAIVADPVVTDDYYLVGATDAHGEEVKDRPVSPVDVVASIFTRMGFDLDGRAREFPWRLWILAALSFSFYVFHPYP